MNVPLEHHYAGLVMVSPHIATIQSAMRKSTVGLAIFAAALIASMRTGDASCIFVESILTIGNYAPIAPAIAKHSSQSQIIQNGHTMF